MNRSKILIFAVVQFVLLTLAAMYFFPGGSFHDHGASSYEFGKNFFSDLGATRTFRGESNWPSFILFTFALSFLGVAMVIYSFHLKELSPSLIFQRISRSSLVLSGKSFIAVALIPLNIDLAAHNFFVKAGFLTLLVYVICLISLQFKKCWGKIFLTLNFAYLGGLLFYLYVLFLGPTAATPSGLAFQVICQKMIVYFSIINIGLQTWGIHRSHSALT